MKIKRKEYLYMGIYKGRRCGTSSRDFIYSSRTLFEPCSPQSNYSDNNNNILDSPQNFSVRI